MRPLSLKGTASAPVSHSLLLLRTLRHLRMEQVLWRVWYRLRRASPRGAVDLPCAPVVGPWVAPVAGAPRMVGPCTFRLLNQRGEVGSPKAWNASSIPKLWLYNLHYFDDLVARGAEDRTDWHRDYMARWIAENPPGGGNGWEPYPTSLRVVNWIKWSLAGNALTDEARRSLGLQARWLRRSLEYHILGNHLFANAKALVFAGLFFQGREADGWLRKGLSLLRRELPEQVLPDGGQFERSPMYHLIAVEDCLDLVNVMRAYGASPMPLLLDAVARMLRWAGVMTHPDGGVPFFNDATLGVAPTVSVVSAYAGRLGLAEAGGDDGDGVVHLADSGYVRFRRGGLTAFLDLAPVGPDYLPGHAHADTLSLEASVYGQRLLVNSGISLYEAGPERDRQRGTGAHNTVMVDGENSSEVWAGFRVARRAYVRDVVVDAGEGVAAGSHDGYRRLAGGPIHRRWVVMGPDSLEITDEVTGGGDHRLELRWHLHPDVRVEEERSAGDGVALVLRVEAEDGPRAVRLAVSGMTDWGLEPSTYHPGFGISQASQCLVARLSGSLPGTFVTRLQF